MWMLYVAVACLLADCSFCSFWLSIGCLVVLHLAGLLVYWKLVNCLVCLFLVILLALLVVVVGCCMLFFALQQWNVLVGARRRRRRRRGRSKKQEGRSKKEEEGGEEKEGGGGRRRECNMHTCIDIFGYVVVACFFADCLFVVVGCLWVVWCFCTWLGCLFLESC